MTYIQKHLRHLSYKQCRLWKFLYIHLSENIYTNIMYIYLETNINQWTNIMERKEANLYHSILYLDAIRKASKFPSKIQMWCLIQLINWDDLWSCSFYMFLIWKTDTNFARFSTTATMEKKNTLVNCPNESIHRKVALICNQWIYMDNLFCCEPWMWNKCLLASYSIREQCQLGSNLFTIRLMHKHSP